MPDLTSFTTSQGRFPLAHVEGPHQVVPPPLEPPPMVSTAQPFVQPGAEMILHNVCGAVPAYQPPVQQLNAFQGYNYGYGMPFPSHVSTPNLSQSAPQQGFYQQSVTSNLTMHGLTVGITHRTEGGQTVGDRLAVHGVATHKVAPLTEPRLCLQAHL